MALAFLRNKRPSVEAMSNHLQTCIERGYIIVLALCTHEWGGELK
jgi:hypothetical protein